MARKYLYVYQDKKSRDFAKLVNSVNAGAEKVRREADWITYHVGVEGESAGRARKFREAKDRAIELRKKLGLGKGIRIVTKKNGEGVPLDVVRFVEIEDDLQVVNGPGCEGIDRAEAWVRENLPNSRWAGDCVCKHTTTGAHSDHADCAAVDYFNTMVNMQKMRAEFVNNRPDYYHTKYVLLGSYIYYPGQAPRLSGVDYHAHMHLSVYGGRYNSAC
jgi:hypothetical protein